jgi:HEAT repeat protein
MIRSRPNPTTAAHGPGRWPGLAVAALLLATSLPAHGGLYRGPGSPTGPGGPTTPSTGSPTTGAGPTIPDEASWQQWWEFNKDPFVQQDTTGSSVPTTGSDDYYLGPDWARLRIDTLAPTDADRRNRIVPTLVAMMDAERNRDIQTACLMALGKMNSEAPGVDLVAVLAERLTRDDQEVRDTAALALGVSGRPAALPLLLALQADGSDGRKLCARDSVGDRMRAFAAYGLGFAARGSRDTTQRQQVHDALWHVVRDPAVVSRDLRIASISALGLLCDPAQPGHRRLASVTADELLAWFAAPRGRGDEAILAHAPIAIGRLLGRGASHQHQACKEQFLATLQAKERRSNEVLRSAAIALGMLSEPAERLPADAATAHGLQQYYDKGVDRHTRYFAAIALGRIGGAANRAWLLRTYQRANRFLDRPWIALALGLIAAEAATREAVDVVFAEMLIEDLQQPGHPMAQAGLAVALGMTRHAPGTTLLKRMLQEHEHDEQYAGYLCVGLAMLGDRTATPQLTELLARSRRRPFLLQQAAVALGRLGDRDANDHLIGMMRASESVVVLAALANAIGLIGDRRAIAPLLELAQDPERTRLARAFVAAALGGIGDTSLLPWNHPLGRDSNYTAPVDTLSNGATGVLDIL